MFQTVKRDLHIQITPTAKERLLYRSCVSAHLNYPRLDLDVDVNHPCAWTTHHWETLRTLHLNVDLNLYLRLGPENRKGDT